MSSHQFLEQEAENRSPNIVNSRSVLKVALRLLIGIALLTFLFRYINGHEFVNIFLPDWRFLALAYLTSLLGNLFGVARWSYALRLIGEKKAASFFRLFRIFMRATVVGLVVVGGTLAIIYQALSLTSEDDLRLKHIFYSIILDRIFDPLYYLVIIANSALYIFEIITLKQMFWVLFGSLTITLLITTYRSKVNHFLIRIYLIIFDIFLNFSRRLKYLITTQAKEKDTLVISSIRDQFSVANISYYSLCRILCLVTRLYLIALAVGYDLPYTIFFACIGVFILTFVLSITPGGVGVTELGITFLLVKYGMNVADASTLSISFRLYLTLFSILSFGIGFALEQIINKRFSISGKI